MVNRIWPTAVVGEADSVSSVSASACHIGGPNSVNPGQILLVYGKFAAAKVSTGAMFFISTHSFFYLFDLEFFTQYL